MISVILYLFHITLSNIIQHILFALLRKIKTENVNVMLCPLDFEYLIISLYIKVYLVLSGFIGIHLFFVAEYLYIWPIQFVLTSLTSWLALCLVRVWINWTVHCLREFGWGLTLMIHIRYLLLHFLPPFFFFFFCCSKMFCIIGFSF